MAILTKQIPDVKIKKIDKIADSMKKSGTIGIVDIKGVPAKELHDIRSKLRKDVSIEIVKKTIIRFAIEKCKKELNNIEGLEEKMGTMPALILSSLDPFRISKLFIDNKAPASAKAGQIAPEDIIIQAGPTPFVPGPML